MASSLTRRGKLLAVVIGILAAAAIIAAGVYTAFWSDVTPPKREKNNGSQAQSAPPAAHISKEEVKLLESRLNSTDPAQRALAITKDLHDQVVSNGATTGPHISFDAASFELSPTYPETDARISATEGEGTSAKQYWYYLYQEPQANGGSRWVIVKSTERK